MPGKNPNILILFTDMQRADTIHALGNDIIRTPHLDRLAAEGTAYTNCFTPSPVCVPARCCMHYGLYPQNTGTFDLGPMMPHNGNSYADVLARNGYRTHAIGKCHFTPDHSALRGFQSRRSQEECQADPQRDDYIAWLKERGYDTYEVHGARGEMYYIPQISSLPANVHPTAWIAAQSIQFIRENADGAKPWCLFSSFIHPHPPLAPPKPWHKLYRTPDMPLPIRPDNRMEHWTWINRLQNRYKYRDRGIDLNLVRTIKAYYYATISFIDYQIGRILETLEAAGQLDNTLILYSSDHGELLGDFDCFGKRSMHDGSSRVPLIIRYAPRFDPGRKCTTAVSLVDVFPTLLGAAELSADGIELDGVDLAEVPANSDDKRTVYSQFCEGPKAIVMAVSEDWKYVYSAGDQSEFLYDRRSDPLECTNVAASPSVQITRNEMKRGLLEFLARTGCESSVVAATDDSLDWRPYPRLDESYLAEPDARLLVQDYPSYEFDLPEYTSEDRV